MPDQQTAKDHRAHDAEGKLSKEYKPDADETCGFGWFFQDETCVCGKMNMSELRTYEFS